MRKVINISLPAPMAKIVKKVVKTGSYSSTSEFFRDLLRDWQKNKLLSELKESKLEISADKGKVLRSLKEMPFPKREWADIVKQLGKTGFCSSTRCCEQLGKYKIGNIYKTPWGDKVKIIKVTRYLKAEDIPNKIL